MSMYPQGIGTIPAETIRVARAAYPKGSLAMRLRDELGGIYQDEQFGSLVPARGQPAEAPWRLAIVLVLQYVEGLTDRQAAEAVRGRIDWKYALGLKLEDPGMDASVLAEFRERLVEGQAETLLLDAQSARWTPLCDPERIEIVFARTTCATCPCRTDCTRSQTTGRVLHIRPQAAQEALLARRQEQQTPAFRQRYARRAGIEGTLSQGVRRMGLRRARYDGLQQTHLQHVLTAVAINLVRIDAILTGIPRGQTRHPPFASLATHPKVQRKVA